MCEMGQNMVRSGINSSGGSEDSLGGGQGQVHTGKVRLKTWGSILRAVGSRSGVQSV